jgi:hypothetical protein
MTHEESVNVGETPRAPQEEAPPGGVRPSLLWFGFLGAGAAWFLQHFLGFGLTELNCHSTRLAFDIVGIDAALFLGLLLTVLAAAVALAATLIAFRSVPGGLLQNETEEPGATEYRGRVFFLGYVGALLGVLFLLAILTGSAALLFLRPC